MANHSAGIRLEMDGHPLGTIQTSKSRLQEKFIGNSGLMGVTFCLQALMLLQCELKTVSAKLLYSVIKMGQKV